LFPTVYTRSFPGSDTVKTYSYSYTSTAILCFVGAVGLGPICIGFSYLGSPKKGRYAAAYALYLPMFIAQAAGFVADNANRTICQYLSLDTTEQSVQSCIAVYAVSFAVREIFFFALFLTIVFRQEYYWACFSWGCSAVLSCNFFIYQYSQMPIINVAMTVIVIVLILGLYIVSQYSRRQKVIEANEKTKNDAKEYKEAFSKYVDKHQKRLRSSRIYSAPLAPAKSEEPLKNVDLEQHFPQSALRKSICCIAPFLKCLPLSQTPSNHVRLPLEESLNNVDLMKEFWPNDEKSPLEDSKYHITIRQHCSDFERLYFLAESVNTPFHSLIESFCFPIHPAGLASSECKQFLKPPKYVDIVKVRLGPIKSTQRAIEKVQYQS
jgi:hypothetical protein